MRHLWSILLLVFILLTSIFSEKITLYLVSSVGLSWTISFVLPKLVALAFSLLLAKNMYNSIQLSNGIKWAISILVLAAGVGFYLSQNLPYTEDYKKSGTELNLSDNTELQIILAENESFDGILMIASPSCPHCMKAAKHISILQKRVPERDIKVLMYTLTQEKINDFILDSGVKDLDYKVTDDNEATLTLCEGKFPSFVYIKDKKVVHKWNNYELGFPALDWIETGLE